MGQTTNDRNPFYTRGFTTFLMGLLFLVVVTTGLVLYATPRGRVANWTGWSVAGLTKEQWGSVHITATLTFIAAAAIHIWYNWKVLLNYIRSRRASGFRMKREFGAAAAVVVLTVAGTLADVPPYGTAIAAHEWIKDYWENAHVPAPVAHAEDLSLAALAGHTGMTDVEARSVLAQAGYRADRPDATVADIAAANNLTPQELFRVLPRGEGQHAGAPVQGLGRQSLAAYCRGEGLRLDQAVALLAEAGVGAKGTTTMRQLAEQMGGSTHDVAAKLRAAVGKEALP